MFTLLTVLIILICILLTLVVLVQSSKGDGLAGGFGGVGGAGAMFGVRRTSDFLMKFTIGLGAAFFILCIIVNVWFLPSSSRRSSVTQEGEAPVPTQSVPSMPQSAPATAPQSK